MASITVIRPCKAVRVDRCYDARDHTPYKDEVDCHTGERINYHELDYSGDSVRLTCNLRGRRITLTLPKDAVKR